MLSTFVAAPVSPTPSWRSTLNKVPEVILIFWVIKVLCTTVGETFADFLNVQLGLGLTSTTLVIGAMLIVAVVIQMRLPRYVPPVYWAVVVLTSIVGTLITDNLTDNLGIHLTRTTIVFGVILAIVFGLWYAVERTLSIHSIRTRRREGFYWLAILFTFALGTAAGDLVAERMALGYLLSLVLFIAMIATVAIAHFRFGLDAILAFWIAYILTRPLGASIGDFLSQAPADGGLGLGTTATSAIFLVAILGLVAYLVFTKRDSTGDDGGGGPSPREEPAYVRALSPDPQDAGTRW